MFNKTSWIIGVIAGLSLIVGLHSADGEYWNYGKYMHIEFTFAGTWISTRMDLYPQDSNRNPMPDNWPADWFTQECFGTLGKYSTQGVVENVFQVAIPGCPDTVVIIDADNNFGFGNGIASFANGDQIYSKIKTRTLCSEGEGRYSASETGFYVGGTGKFAGVSGWYEMNYTSFPQVTDNNILPLQQFGSFTGRGTGLLVFPQAQYWERR